MWTALLLAGSLALTQAEAPAAASLARDVKRLVRQLDDPQLAQRGEAEQALVKLGPAALPLLPEVTDRTPPETVQRLQRVRGLLEKEQAAQAGRGSLVTLKADEMPVSDALAIIAKQSGNAIKFDKQQFDDASPEPKVSVAFDKTPFWQALDEVLDQAGMTIDDFAGESGLAVAPRPPKQHARAAHRSLRGAFRLAPARFEAVRDLTNSEGRSLRLSLRLAWEPKLRMVAVALPVDSLKLTDGEQKELSVDGSQGEISATVNQGATALEFDVPLAPPPRSVEKIGSIQGTLNLILLGPPETFRFDKLPVSVAGKGPPAKVELSKAGVTVSVGEVRKNNDLWEVRTRIRFERKSPSFESHRLWVTDNEAYLVAGKQRIPFGGIESTSTDEAEFGVTYLFFDLKKSPTEMAFVYKTPVSVLELPLEFELKDLLLP